MYNDEARREELQASSKSVDEFLGELKMIAKVGECGPTTVERIHQLLGKTNQFNLTTRRHSREEVERLAKGPGSKVLWLRLEDRFGDMGLVCVGIVRKDAADPKTWEVDSFLMSCRVMGRQVEEAFLAYLAEHAAREGATKLKGVFVPTAKNSPVKTFYPDHGFQEAGGTGSSQLYARDVDQIAKWPKLIAREDER
jgi:FkbH-like protein